MPGLYAAGEATGSSHGASRFGGSALSDAMVFGAIAAEDATAYARDREVAPSIDNAETSAKQAKIESWMDRNLGADLADAVAIIRDNAVRHLNIVRNEAGLKEVCSAVEGIESKTVPEFAAQGLSDRETGAKIRMAIEAIGQTTALPVSGERVLGAQGKSWRLFRWSL